MFLISLGAIALHGIYESNSFLNTNIHTAPGAAEEPQRAGKIFERSGVWVSYHPIIVDAAGRIPPEEGGSSGSSIETTKKSTSSLYLEVREVVVPVVLKHL